MAPNDVVHDKKLSEAGHEPYQVGMPSPFALSAEMNINQEQYHKLKDHREKTLVLTSREL